MKLLILLLVVLFSGCSAISVKTPDCEATYTAVFRDVDAANVSVCGGSMEVLGSDSNTKMVEKIIPLLVK